MFGQPCILLSGDPLRFQLTFLWTRPDLICRSKIFTGVIPKNRQRQPSITLLERLFPAFVSPKKLDPIKQPAFTFEPPLLSVERQNPEPAFFAGSTEEYRLPTRLGLNHVSSTHPGVYRMGTQKRNRICSFIFAQLECSV